MSNVYRAVKPALVGLALLALGLTACGPLTQGDELDGLETKNAQLQGTIEVFGTPAGTMAMLQQAATQSVLFENQLNEARGTALAVQATLTKLELEGLAGGFAPATSIPAAPPGDQGAPAAITPSPGAGPITTPVAQVAASGTRFTNTVTARSRDSQDCPLEITSVFNSTIPSINVVTRILDLKSGSTISAVWRANGSLFFDDVNCWTPREDWSDVCAYCSITPDGPTFPTGNWTVELSLDGSLMAQSTFQVVDPQAGTTPDPMSATPANE